MTVGLADLQKAINTLWDSAGLDTTFNDLWDTADKTVFTVLNDGEATPGSPFPYCVFETGDPEIITRMSGDADTNRTITNVPFSFRVHSRVDNEADTAKQIASEMIEAIMEVYGGHPTEAPSDLVLDNGNFLITQYVNEISLRTGDSEYEWILNYNFVLDVPFAI